MIEVHNTKETYIPPCLGAFKCANWASLCEVCVRNPKFVDGAVDRDLVRDTNGKLKEPNGNSAQQPNP